MAYRQNKDKRDSRMVLKSPFRQMLMLDAYDRAKEASVSVRYNKAARRLLYGQDD